MKLLDLFVAGFILLGVTGILAEGWIGLAGLAVAVLLNLAGWALMDRGRRG